MGEDLKAYMIVIGAFMVSIISTISDLFDKDIVVTKKIYCISIKSWVFWCWFGINRFFWK